MSLARPGGPQGEQDSKRALYQAFEEVVRTQQGAGQQKSPAKARRHLFLPLCLLTLAVVVGYVAVARPAWLFGTPPAPQSTERIEAGLRIALYMEAQRVEQFRRANGRLPETLQEAGVTGSTTEYDLLSPSSYVMRGTSGALSLRLSSADSLTVFLGNSFDVLRGGRP